MLGNIYQLTRSRDLAMRDDLTKAFNRRFFESYLDEEIERSRRYGALFSIIFLDLDDLKTVNNFYGHLTGSRTLQEVAKRILARRARHRQSGPLRRRRVLHHPAADRSGAGHRGREPRPQGADRAPFHLDANIEISITRQLRHRHVSDARRSRRTISSARPTRRCTA